MMEEGRPTSDRKIRRLARIAERTREIVSQVILYELKDPRIGFVTVLEARVTPDVKEATILISVLGSQSEKNRTMAAIEHSRPYIQRRLGKALQTRNTPILKFKLDETAERMQELEEVFEKIRRERMGQEERPQQDPKDLPLRRENKQEQEDGD